MIHALLTTRCCYRETIVMCNHLIKMCNYRLEIHTVKPSLIYASAGSAYAQVTFAPSYAFGQLNPWLGTLPIAFQNFENNFKFSNFHFIIVCPTPYYCSFQDWNNVFPWLKWCFSLIMHVSTTVSMITHVNHWATHLICAYRALIYFRHL